MFAAHRDVLRVLYSMAQLDPDAVGGAVQRDREEPGRGMARLARGSPSRRLLRADVTPGEAAHVLWLLTSFDAFDLLYTGRGLPVDEVATLLATTAERALYRLSGGACAAAAPRGRAATRSCGADRAVRGGRGGGSCRRDSPGLAAV